jgi:hypothetical protein
MQIRAGDLSLVKGGAEDTYQQVGESSLDSPRKPIGSFSGVLVGPLLDRRIDRYLDERWTHYRLFVWILTGSLYYPILVHRPTRLKWIGSVPGRRLLTVFLRRPGAERKRKAGHYKSASCHKSARS